MTALLILIVTGSYKYLKHLVTLTVLLPRNFSLRPAEILQIKLSDSTFTPASGYIGFGFFISPRGIDAGGGGVNQGLKSKLHKLMHWPAPAWQ